MNTYELYFENQVRGFQTPVVLFKEYEDNVCEMGHLLPGGTYSMKYSGQMEADYAEKYEAEREEMIREMDESEDFIW